MPFCAAFVCAWMNKEKCGKKVFSQLPEKFDGKEIMDALLLTILVCAQERESFMLQIFVFKKDQINRSIKTHWLR